MAAAHQGRAAAALLMGDQARAAQHMARAYELHPVSTLISANYGWTELVAGRPDRAIELCEAALRLGYAPNDSRLCLMRAYTALGRQEDAGAHALAFMAAAKAAPDEISAVAAARNRDIAFERWRLDELRNSARPGDAAPARLALLHASQGERAAALDLLERALRERDAALPFLLLDPAFDAIAQEPRFTTVLDRVRVERTRTT